MSDLKKEWDKILVPNDDAEGKLRTAYGRIQELEGDLYELEETHEAALERIEELETYGYCPQHTSLRDRSELLNVATALAAAVRVDRRAADVPFASIIKTAQELIDAVDKTKLEEKETTNEH